LQLQVHLWDGVIGEDGGIGYITDGGRLDHVSDGESLDGLVLRCASRAVRASDWLDVAAAFLVSSIGRSLFNHDGGVRSQNSCDVQRKSENRVNDAGGFFLTVS